MEFIHKSVLLNECIDALNIEDNHIYVDGTLGLAGHSTEILKRLNLGTLICIDLDLNALNYSKSKLLKLKEENNNKTELKFLNMNFKELPHFLEKHNLKVDGILLDLGVSSYQLDDETRGFSYMKDARLDMRMNTKQEIDAQYIINNYSEEQLMDIFFKYGEEKYSKKIAKEIVNARKIKPINTTFELVGIIDKCKPFNKKNGHKAKKVFQSLRIEVNKELNDLEKTIHNLVKLLNKNGKLVVITFHSLEDKIVKKAMVDMEGRCTCPKDFPVCVCNKITYGKLITKKPILPTNKEMSENSRSKSAKLRIFQRI